jgi:hypothetical protein
MSKIEVRRLNFDFSANTEKYWFKQSVFRGCLKSRKVYKKTPLQTSPPQGERL